METLTQNTESPFKNILIKALLCTIVLLLIYIVFTNWFKAEPQKGKIDPKTVYNYTPKIITVDKPYPVYYNTDNGKSDKENKIDPLLLQNFKRLNNKIDSIIKGKNSTEIIYESPEGVQSYYYSNDFLTNYTNNSKLLDFQLELDKLTISLLNPQGETSQQTYPLYFDNFKYYWKDNELHKVEIKDKSKSKFWDKANWNQLYINGGYSLLQSSPMLSGEYNIIMGRFKLNFNQDIIIKTNPELNTTVKLGYRLFK